MKKMLLIIGCLVIFGVGSGCAKVTVSAFQNITSDGKDLWVVFNTTTDGSNYRQTLWKCTPIESGGETTVWCTHVKVEGIEEISNITPITIQGVDSGESWNDKRKRKQKN